MARNRVTATLDIACWKEHECCACGTTFRYLFKRKEKGAGVSEEQAREQATRAGLTAVRRQVELQPCPTCGLYQPDMIGSWRSRRHLIVTCIGLVLLAGAFILSIDRHIPREAILWGALAAAGATVLAHFFVARRPFNQDRESNLRRARQDVEEGRVLITASYSKPVENGEEHFHQGGLAPIFLLMILAALAIPTAEVVRRSQDWPINPEYTPQVAGPGDTMTVWFPQQIQAVKGLWNGTVTAQVLNANELGLPNAAIQVETSRETWDNTIRISDRSKDPNVLTSPWVKLTIPEISEARAKTLKVQIDLLVTYPSARGREMFEVLQKPCSRLASVTLAPPGSGRVFTLLWWGMGVGGAFLVVAGGFLLALRASWLSLRALPTRVFPLDQEHSKPGGLAPSLLVATSPIQVSRTDFAPQELSDEKLKRGAGRTRVWLWTMILLMVLGCGGIISVPHLFKKQTGDIAALVCCGILVVGLVGTVLLGWDMIRYRREQRARRSTEEDE
jgi:hypothetical protein